jgi:predicted esterase
MADRDNPHLAIAPVLAGAPLGQAPVAAVLVHGRDQDPAFMMGLVERLALDGVSYVLPDAHEDSWYPGSYLDPVEDNEPWLSESLEAYGAVLRQIADAGVPAARTVLVGFSQGACITAELVARSPQAFGAVAVLTGALMGPRDVGRSLPEALRGVPVFLGCSVDDDWIAIEDVERTADAFAAAGAAVTLRRYDADEHAIYDDEVAVVRGLLEAAGR